MRLNKRLGIFETIKKACIDCDVKQVRDFIRLFGIKKMPFKILNGNYDKKIISLLAPFIAKNRNFKFLIRKYCSSWFDGSCKKMHTYFVRSLVNDKLHIVKIFLQKKKYKDLIEDSYYQDAICENKSLKCFKHIVKFSPGLVAETLFRSHRDLFLLAEKVKGNMTEIHTKLNLAIISRDPEIMRCFIRNAKGLYFHNFKLDDFTDLGENELVDPKCVDVIKVLVEENNVPIQDLRVLFMAFVHFRNKVVVKYMIKKGYDVSFHVMKHNNENYYELIYGKSYKDHYFSKKDMKFLNITF